MRSKPETRHQKKQNPQLDSSSCGFFYYLLYYYYLISAQKTRSIHRLSNFKCEIHQERRIDAYPAKLRRAACWHLRLRFALMRFVRRDFLPPSIHVFASMFVDFLSVAVSTFAIPAKQKQKTIAVNKYFIILQVCIFKNDKCRLLL